MGRFRNKAIETELRRVPYSLMKAAHCTKSVCPAGPPSSGRRLLPSPAGALSVAHRMLYPRLCFLPIFLSPRRGGYPSQKESCTRRPKHVPGSWAKSVVVGDESASFRRGRDKQPVHRRPRQVAVQEVREQWAPLIGPPVLPSAPRPPHPPPPRGQDR